MPSVSPAPSREGLSRIFKQLTTVKISEPKITVGCDVGSSSVKVVVLGPRKGLGARPLLHHQLIPLDAGPEASSSGAVNALASALPVRTVNLSVSGQLVVMRIVELPMLNPDEMRQALPFEAQRYLPFNLQDVVIDGAVLGPADANKAWVLIVACKKELVERRLTWAKEAGLEPALIDVDALAMVNAFLAGQTGAKLDGTRALINVGAHVTNLVMLQRDVPYLVRDIPWGGEKLVQAAAEHSGGESAAIRRALSAGPLPPDVQDAVTAASDALITELQLSFDYFENRFGHPPADVLLSGGLPQAAGFLEALKRHLTQTVSGWEPLKGLSGQFAVAYGLALRTS